MSPHGPYSVLGSYSGLEQSWQSPSFSLFVHTFPLDLPFQVAETQSGFVFGLVVGSEIPNGIELGQKRRADQGEAVAIAILKWRPASVFPICETWPGQLVSGQSHAGRSSLVGTKLKRDGPGRVELCAIEDTLRVQQLGIVPAQSPVYFVDLALVEADAARAGVEDRVAGVERDPPGGRGQAVVDALDAAAGRLYGQALKAGAPDVELPISLHDGDGRQGSLGEFVLSRVAEGEEAPLSWLLSLGIVVVDGESRLVELGNERMHYGAGVVYGDGVER